MTPLLIRCSSRIRYKVLAAALVIIAMIGTIGAVGLGYVHAVTQSVAETTERTSPLLASASAASEASRRLVALARDGNAICAIHGADGGQAKVPTWRAEFEAIDRLREMASGARLKDRASNLARATSALADTLSSIAYLCREKHITLVKFDQQKRGTLQNLSALAAVITQLALAFDGEMTLSEENAKISLQLGQAQEANIDTLLSKALLDIWPMLRSLYRLREYEVRLQNTLDQADEIHEPGGLKSSASSRAESLTAMQSLIRRIAPRLSSLGKEREASSLATLVNVAERGVEDQERTRSELKQLNDEVVQKESSLTQIENALALEMKSLEDKVRSLDGAAQATMKHTIEEATLVVGLVGGLCVFGTLLAAMSFTTSLTRPIEALTVYAKHVQERQFIAYKLSPALLQRSDEIGRLASSFNDTFAALEEARRHLLAESRAAIQIQLERFKTAIEGVPQGIYLLGADKRLLLSNSRFAEIYGLTAEQVSIGTRSEDIETACGIYGFSGEWEHAQPPLAPNVVESDARQATHRLLDGRTIIVTTAPTPDGGAVVVHEDVTERRRAEAKIMHMAHHDALTGLANRTLFREQINESLARLRPEHTLAVLCLDLDHFKSVNDALGHPFGDRLLVMASERLCSCLREHDHVARLGGDEFAVIMNSNPSPDEAGALATRIINTVGKLYEIDDQQAVIGVSIGIAVAPIDGDDADRLMKGADMALYRAKKEGRNTHCFFEPDMDARMQERRRLELALRNALVTGALELHYQPLFNMQTKEIEEFEALLRWTDPVHGRIGPDVFIPLAEETGIINEIGAWVLKQACSDAASWPDHIRVAVNISPLQFRTRTLVLNVLTALEAASLVPHRLELEITEGVLLSDTEATLQILNQLHDIGVRIAMDDFGTGYSSLGYLRKFNFDKVKIDRSFVNELDDTADSRAIIRAVCGLCSSLSIEVTAEGVETEKQLAALREEGCTQAQGYLMGRPGPISSVAAYFDNQSKRASGKA